MIKPHEIKFSPSMSDKSIREVCNAVEHYHTLVKALEDSSERLECVFKNTGSLGCRAQMEYNQILLTEINK